MTRRNACGLWMLLSGLVCACAPINQTNNTQYQLDAFSAGAVAKKTSHYSLLVSQPDSSAGYQTEQMLYSDRPYVIRPFVHNAWVSSPAHMLYPLILQSLQHEHYFYAVSANPAADRTDYRLDTQIMRMQQNFMHKPSTVELRVHAVVTHVDDQRVLASRLLVETIPCTQDTPYGGVMAANLAAKNLTAALTRFVTNAIVHDHEVHH